MEKYLYRYISFEKFVGMIQKKALTFVLPELWEDPCESSWFLKYISQIDSPIDRMLLMSVHCRTYCQCWTRLSESDAMWRIYSYGNRAIRLRIKQSNVEKLGNIDIMNVDYRDVPQFPQDTTLESFLKILSVKRTAFEHEKEVRLIKRYYFADIEDAEMHCKAWMAAIGDSGSYKLAEELFPNYDMKHQVKGVAEILNLGNEAQKTLDVPYSSIPEFIDSVLLHPFAPEWYAEIVKELCENNGISFEGKSELYCDNTSKV